MAKDWDYPGWQGEGTREDPLRPSGQLLAGVIEDVMEEYDLDDHGPWCVWCGDPLPPGRRTFCSEECYRTSLRERYKGADRRWRWKPYDESDLQWLRCPTCGRAFLGYPNLQTFCSSSCAGRSNGLVMAKRGLANAPHYKCQGCGRDMVYTRAFGQGRHAIFCEDCLRKWKRVRQEKYRRLFHQGIKELGIHRPGGKDHYCFTDEDHRRMKEYIDKHWDEE